MVVINLVSNLNENFDIHKFYAYNHTVAYSLREALLDLGHDVNMIKDHAICSEDPISDHTIVISAVAMNKIKNETFIAGILKHGTRGKLALWLDAAFPGWDEKFDQVLTVAPPYKGSSEKYRWVGYAADPTIFYSDQKEKTAFVDSYPWGWYEGAHDWIYRCIQQVLAESDVRMLQPVPIYNKGRRAFWPEMWEAFRASHFHITTQIGNFGLTNIEATTCGAQLVLHEDLNRPRTWPFEMPHVTWKTKEDLKEILATWPNLQENRRISMEHTWRKVASRVLEALQ